jgi:hypothetical protein
VNDEVNINKTIGQLFNEFNTKKNQNYIIREKTKSIDGSGFCQNVTFEDNEFKDNKALNDQCKDEGTIIVTAQLNLNMSWSLTR